MGLNLNLSLSLANCSAPWVLAGASLDMDFSHGRYYGGAFADLLSTTRASTGYAQTSSGLLVPFASNVPRITDQGLLVEEARTNLVLQSQTFGTSWTASNTTVTSDAAVAPDGTTTADQVSDGVATGVFHSVDSANLTTVNATVYTASIYAKANSGQFLQIAGFNGSFGANAWGNFDLVAGVVGTMGSAVTASSITSLGNGWYRCSITVPATASTGSGGVFFPIITAANSTRAPTFNGANRTFFVWGAQLEAGSFPTSYIPTTTVAVTRAADVITLTGAAATAVQGATGSILAQTNTLVNGTGTYSPYIVGGNDQNNSAFTRVNTATTSYSKLANTVLNSTLGSGAYNTGRVKTGVAWSAAGRSLVANNGTVATDANAPTAPTTTYIGSVNGSSPANGLFERVTIWNSRLADATFKANTAP